jgi:hypothetical protein
LAVFSILNAAVTQKPKESRDKNPRICEVEWESRAHGRQLHVQFFSCSATLNPFYSHTHEQVGMEGAGDIPPNLHGSTFLQRKGCVYKMI